MPVRNKIIHKALTALIVSAPLVLAGCGGSSSSSFSAQVSGAATGLVGSSVELQLNDDERLTLEADGLFSFETRLRDQASYEVLIVDQPSDQNCSLNQGSGTVERPNDVEIILECEAPVAVRAHSDLMYVALEWDSAGSVDILMSTEADCDWDNYASCDNGNILLDVADSPLELEALADDLGVNQNWYFVVEEDAARSAQATAKAGAVGFDQRVYDVAIHDGEVLVAGDFNWAGMAAQNLAAVDAESGRATGVTVSADSRLTAILPDGDGGYFIAGRFDHVNGLPRNGLARILPDGTLDTDWVPALQADARIADLAMAGDELYLVGSFRPANSVSGASVAGLDVNTGANLSSLPQPNGELSAIAVAGDTLFVGGEFDAVSGDARTSLAAIDLQTAELLSWAPEVLRDGGGIGEVEALKVADGVLYVGGRFALVNGDERGHGASFDVATLELGNWNPQADGDIYALAVSDDRVFVGGNFADIAGEARERLAAVSASDGQLLALPSVGVDNRIRALTVDGDNLYLGGAFRTVDGVERQRLASIDLTTDELRAWQPDSSGEVHALAMHQGNVLAGGNFDLINLVPRTSLAALSLESGRLSEVQFDLDARIEAIHLDGDRLYVGGAFTSIDGQSRGRLAAIDLVSMDLDAWNPPSLDAYPKVIQSAGGTVYVGGLFQNVGTQARSRLAAFDAVAGSLLSWNPQSTSLVNDLMIEGGTAYVAAQTTQAQDHVAGFSLATGDRTSWEPDVGGNPVVMLQHDDHVLLGGSFTSVDGTVRNRLARISLVDGSLDSFHPNFDSSVSSLALTPTWLYVGGGFSEGGTRSVDRLARVRLSTGDVSHNWNPGANATVSALLHDDGLLIVGGSFTEVSGGHRPRFAVLNAIDGSLAW